MLAMWGLGACQSAPVETGGDTESTEPWVTLLAPVEGDTVCGDPFALEVAVENFTLVGFEEEQKREGIGHVDIQLNGQNRWMTYKNEFEIPHVDEGIYLAPSAFETGFISVAHTEEIIDRTAAAAERVLCALVS